MGVFHVFSIVQMVSNRAMHRKYGTFLKYSIGTKPISYRHNTAQKMKFSIKDFFSKFDQIRRFLRICSHFLKKSFLENFIFCAVQLLVNESSLGLLMSLFTDIIYGSDDHDNEFFCKMVDRHKSAKFHFQPGAEAAFRRCSSK